MNETEGLRSLAVPQLHHHLLATVVCLFLIASCAGSDGLATSSEAEPTAEPDTESIADADPTATAEPTPEPEPTPTVAPTSTAVPTPLPTPEPTAEPTAVPTAVPPTPVWVQQASGPTASPYTYVVLSAADEAQFVDGAEGSEIDALVDANLVGAPVLSGSPEDDVVEVAVGNRTAWVRTDGLDFGWSSRILEIDVAQNRIRVFEGNELLIDVAAATGATDTPTMPLSGHVRIDASEGSLPELSLVAYADDGATIELAVSDGDLGGYTTEGDVEIERSTALLLASLLQSGARAEVVGTPTAFPTPPPPRATAVPVTAEPTPIPGDCPDGSLGTPGDCYFLVAGEKFYGPCENDSAVTFNEGCWIFAGDEEFQLDGKWRCPDLARYELDGRCYTPVGERELIDVLCPANATAVDLECRVRVE